MANGFHGMMTYEGEMSEIQAYLARPGGDEPRPAVIVIHEIFGLTDHIKDVAERFAAQGYVVLAPHLYSRPGLAEILSPANVEQAMRFQMSLSRDRASDMAYIKEELAKLPPETSATLEKVLPVYNHLPREAMTQDLVKAVDFLKAQSYVKGG